MAPRTRARTGTAADSIHNYSWFGDQDRRSFHIPQPGVDNRRRLRRHCHPHELLLDVEARDELHETERAEAHHPHSLHGAHILSLRIPLHMVLLACGILPGSQRLLRGLRHLVLLRPHVPLYGPRPARTEGVF